MTHTSQVTDPVCGMTVDPDRASARSSFDGTTYYFCSETCRRAFEAEPARYARPASESEPADSADVPLERHEPPFTKTGGWVAPKFGSAGSGGAEYERLPEAHDERHESKGH